LVNDDSLQTDSNFVINTLKQTHLINQYNDKMSTNNMIKSK